MASDEPINILELKRYAPISVHVHGLLNHQLHEMQMDVLWSITRHQEHVPDSPVAKAIEVRAQRVRLYDADTPRLPLRAARVADLAPTSRDIDPTLYIRLSTAFDSCRELLTARMKQDEHAIWAERAKFAGLRKQLQRDCENNLIPESVPVMLDVAEEMAAAGRGLNWKRVLSQHIAARGGGGSPMRPGA